MTKRISDEGYENMKGMINAAIHEAVMACKHMEQDEVEDAGQALMTVQSTLDAVAQMIAALEEAR